MQLNYLKVNIDFVCNRWPIGTAIGIIRRGFSLCICRYPGRLSLTHRSCALNNKQAPNWGELQHHRTVERAAHLSMMAWFDRAIITCFERPRINEEADISIQEG